MSIELALLFSESVEAINGFSISPYLSFMKLLATLLWVEGRLTFFMFAVLQHLIGTDYTKNPHEAAGCTVDS